MQYRLLINFMVGRLRLVRNEGECKKAGTGRPYEEASAMVSASAVGVAWYCDYNECVFIEVCFLAVRLPECNP